MFTEIITVDHLEPQKERITQAAKILQDGGLVAFPTETVYGIGASLLREEAIRRLYEVKRRPVSKPFSIHIAERKEIGKFASQIRPSAYRLINKFWPGPLTLVLNSKGNLPWLLVKDGKVGLRMPNNRVALSLIKQTGSPIIAPSANLSGNSPPRNAQEVLKELDGLIDMVLDGGNTEIGIESTVVDACVLPVVLLRQGAIAFSDIQRVTKIKTLLFVCTGNSCRSVMAKGMLEKIARQKNKEVDVIAAGVSAIKGMQASKQTRELLAKEGVDVSSHQAEGLTEGMIEAADLIFVMEKFHRDTVLDMVSKAEGKVYFLKDFAKHKTDDLEIPDPIGKPMEVYQTCFETIKDCLEGVLRFL